MAHEDSGILGELAGFHTDKMARHGATSQGAGWNGDDAQRVRFEQVCKVLDPAGGFSVYDLGCGYGALLDHLRPRFADVDYTGCDVTPAMIDAARARHAGDARARFVLGSEPPVSDYGIASGIFSLRFGHSDAEWSRHVEATLDLIDRTSRRGFAFNSLTTYSDAERMRDELYYADPGALFDLCKRKYSRNVALLHDYDLYDFTILVRKP